MCVLGPMSKTDDKIERKGNTSSYCPYAVPLIICFEMRSSLGIAVLAVQVRYQRPMANALTLQFRQSTFGYPRNTQNGTPQSEPGHW